ncbi:MULTISPECIES: hypothetical protein [Larkinella]|uniref:Uncharacterized protein n=2 Tax=Larkinella TaxID=332157 RepID=A0A5N1JFQ1_9BACT|nr:MULTISPECIES: hypothetical protein [Larkinella]KAA9349966.1 hypothetical protein F0P93_21255 [Larkinella humicola]RCR65811.1 hypothetical protein DUE52_30145 [Larkinella punicea]
MYIPPPRASKFFVNEDEMGVNAPVIHQRIIAKLTIGLGNLYHGNHSIPLEPLPEMMLDFTYSSPTPDVILFDNEADQTRIIIEICHTSGLKHDLAKTIRLIDEDDYGVLEGFVYNYKTDQWFRYRKGDGGLTEPSSFSEILQLDLNSFL